MAEKAKRKDQRSAVSALTEDEIVFVQLMFPHYIDGAAIERVGARLIEAERRGVDLGYAGDAGVRAALCAQIYTRMREPVLQ